MNWPCILFGACVLLLPMLGAAGEIRLAHGVVVPGELVSRDATGVVIRASGGDKAIGWEMLAPGSRFRWDPLFRANILAALRGQPRAAWTNPPAALEALPADSAAAP